MPNYTREELVGKTATSNQMRNNIYHLVKFMMDNGVNENEIRLRLKRMGKNIAETQNTIFKVTESNIELVINKIYDKILGSKVTITKSVNNEGTTYIIEDEKCPLCKYHRVDISVPPCDIVQSMVSELLLKKNFKVIDNKVKSSRSLGAPTCIHKYTIMEGGK
ncbi:MAG: hypothetical protein GY870_11525 [archaeon]|nr:hypothetical protein [archaeon]